MRYYDLKKHWTKRIMPHLKDKRLNRILVRDFNRYACWPFLPGDLPCYSDSCDWRCVHRGPEPRFWKYVCAGSCHWLVNHALRLASLAEPKQQWRIVKSAKHSTVWDGEETLFEFNYLAFGTDPDECFKAATVEDEEFSPVILPVGVEICVNERERPWSGETPGHVLELRRRAKEVGR